MGAVAFRVAQFFREQNKYKITIILLLVLYKFNIYYINRFYNKSFYNISSQIRTIIHIRGRVYIFAQIMVVNSRLIARL